MPVCMRVYVFLNRCRRTTLTPPSTPLLNHRKILSIVKRVGEKSKGNLSSFIISGYDEKPWVISGMEDGTSNPLYNTSTHNKSFTVNTVLDYDNTNMLLYLETAGTD